jgi:predicted metal-dependent phosphoesterase TrpH
MRFDLHMHTTRHSGDSSMDPYEMLHRARELGLEGVVITEHDWMWTEKELDELRGNAPELLVLAGVEVSTRQGHFLAYGIKNPFAMPRGINVADMCREVHRQGGVVVAAHPFRFGQRFLEILNRDRPAIDGLELMTSNMDAECRRKAAEVFEQRQLAGIGSSDAHHEDVLGFCYTEFEDAIRDASDLVDAIRQRRTTPHERADLAVGVM